MSYNNNMLNHENKRQKFTRSTCDQIYHSGINLDIKPDTAQNQPFDFNSKNSILKKPFPFIENNEDIMLSTNRLTGDIGYCSGENVGGGYDMDIEDVVHSRIVRHEQKQIDSEEKIKYLREEIAFLNDQLDAKQNNIPYPEGYILEVKDILGTRHVVISEPELDINKREVIELMTFPKGHRLSVQSVLGNRFIALHKPQKQFQDMKIEELNDDDKEEIHDKKDTDTDDNNDDINDDNNNVADEYDGYISDDFKFYGERIRFLRNKHPKNDDETIEEYEYRINKLGEEWLASEIEENERR